MNLTEKEARKRYCFVDREHCLASECMAWRESCYSDGSQMMKLLVDEVSVCPHCKGVSGGCSDCNGAGVIGGRWEQLGYCGLAGKPEVTR